MSSIKFLLDSIIKKREITWKVFKQTKKNIRKIFYIILVLGNVWAALKKPIVSFSKL